MNRGGLFGGLFGGLLAGSLLGSLLMGGGFAGGGILDIIIIGLLVYFGLKFFRSRRQQSENQRYTEEYRTQSYQNPNTADSEYGSAWDNLRSERVQPQPQTANIPSSFNTEEFLTGAKKLYVRMQESWDMRDIDDIKQFTAPIMHKDIEEQFKEDPTPSKTQLLLINASVLEVKEEGDFEQVAVLFDVLMKEQENPENEQVKEIWNFSRDKARNGSWLLDGIQQV